MKTKNLIVLLLIGLLPGLNIQSFAQNSPAAPFLGRWALTLDYEEENAGWLEVRQEDGYLDSDMLWRSGSVEPVDYTLVNENQLILVRGRDVVRKRDEDRNPVRTTHPVNWFQLTATGEDLLEGRVYYPHSNGIGVEEVRFTGKKIPALGEAPNRRKVKYGEPLELFNGKNLQGWELLNKEKTSGWNVVDGILVNNPLQTRGEKQIRYGNLRTTETFEDFNLKVEVSVPAGSNGGIYLRGIYEIQVLDSYGKDLDPHNMGALYSRITPSVAAEKPSGEWQDLDITLYKRYLTVVLNGKKIIDNQPVKGITGGAITSNEFIPGPLLLQGDHGKVSYRKIVLTPILN